jgi:hypothetical protein
MLVSYIGIDEKVGGREVVRSIPKLLKRPGPKTMWLPLS